MSIMMQTVGRLLKQRLAVISLALSTIEVIVVWGSLAVNAIWRQHAALMYKLASDVWVLCGLGAIGLSIAAIAVASPRKIAPIALGVSLIAFLLCGLPMLS